MSPLEQIYSRLYMRCCQNQYRGVKELLEGTNEKIDLAYKKGLFFQLAVTMKGPELLNTLLEYYKKTQLQMEHDSQAYKVAKSKLLKILQEATDPYNNSNAVQKVLDEYLPKEEDSEVDNLEDVELKYDEDNGSTSSHSKEENSEDSAPSSSSTLTEENLKLLGNSYSEEFSDHDVPLVGN